MLNVQRQIGNQSLVTLARHRGGRVPEPHPDRLTVLEAALGAVSGGLAVFDLALRCTLVNAAFAAVYGKMPRSLDGRDLDGWDLDDLVPLQGIRLTLQLSRCLETSAPLACEISLAQHGSSDWRIYLRTCQPLRSATGEVVGVAASLLDITGQKQAEAALRESEQYTRHVAELNPCMQWTSNAAGDVFQMSHRQAVFAELPAGNLTRANWLQAIHPEDAASIDELWSRSLATGAAFDAECRLRVTGQGWRWLRARALCRRNDEGQIVQWYGMVEDVHDRKQIEEDLREKTRRLEAASRQLGLLVRKDHLTGLANRRHFDRTLQREVRLARHSGLPLALLMLDVDQFKHYNDSYGHVAGDLCLRRVGEALQRITRCPQDLVARYGGEEFAIVLPGTTEAQAIEVATRAIDEVRTMALEHSGRPGGRVTLSAGAAMFHDRREGEPGGEGAIASDLIRLADLALYAAKREGRDRAAMAGSVARLATSQLPAVEVRTPASTTASTP